MSTSKKRKAARVWMQQAVKKYTHEGQQRGFREGADRMRADMMHLLPEIDRREVDHVTGKPHVHSVIRKFPDPYEHGPYYRVAMPSGGLFAWPMNVRSQTMQFVDFRPIRNQLTTEGMGGKATLEWFTWEPTEGSEEIGERTSALFTGMGKLAYAASVVEGVATYSMHHAGNGELMRASEIIKECTEEFRRLLGKFAPEPPIEDRRTQQQRYMRRW
jgi:hypothetical protein